MFGFGVLDNFCLPPGFKAPNNGHTAEQLNTVQFMETFNRLVNVALSRFKWEGLPKSCNERALEMTLFFYGKALFFKDENLGFMHTPVNLNGPFNVYWESINRHAYSFEYEHEYTIDNSVVMRNNWTMTPDFFSVWNYAPKIADAIRTIDVHSKTLKRPYALSCQEKEKQTVTTLMKKIDDNEIAVFGSRDMTGQKIEVLNLQVNCMLGEMWSNVKNYYQQAYSALGVESRFQEKKERLITSEIQGESNVIRHVLESALETRQKACEEINQMFGLNLSVSANEIEIFPYELAEPDGGIGFGSGTDGREGAEGKEG